MHIIGIPGYGVWRNDQSLFQVVHLRVCLQSDNVFPIMILITPLRYLWASPNTAIGLLLVVPALVSGGRVRRVQGVLEITGRAVAWVLQHFPFSGPIVALTLGHVVLCADEEMLERWRSHELIHVRQYERWGSFFIPAYLFSSFAARLKGKDCYLDNRFEAEAFCRQQKII